jgi:hypothetical protein
MPLLVAASVLSTIAPRDAAAREISTNEMIKRMSPAERERVVQEVRGHMLAELRAGRANPYPAGAVGHDLHKQTMVRLLQETTFASYLVERMLQFPSSVPPSEFGMALGEELLADGIKRVSDETLVRYFKAEAEFVRVASVPECAGMGRQSLNSAQRRQMMSRLKDSTLEGYYAVMETAIRASLQKLPERPLTPTQDKIVVKYLAEYMAARLTAEEIKAIEEMSDPRQTSDRTVCMSVAVAKAAFEAAGPDMQRWMARWAAFQ